MKRQYQGEREPDKQPRREPGELGEPAVKQVRGSGQCGNGEEREEAVVAQSEVAQRGDDPVGAYSGREPEQPPQEPRREQRQDRLVPDGDPKVPGGAKHSHRADGENQLADVGRRAGQVDIREGPVQ
jgi:hypothetical protein